MDYNFKTYIASQARSRKSAMEGGTASGAWQLRPSRRRHRGLMTESLVLENFAFFCKNNLNLGLF